MDNTINTANTSIDEADNTIHTIFGQTFNVGPYVTKEVSNTRPHIRPGFRDISSKAT